MTIYYVDNTRPDDTGNGTSTATAWKTVAKVNSSSFSGDDQVLFNRGQMWRETLTVPSSGTNGHNIIFGAYGTGVNPVLSGMDLITGFSSGANNTWTVSLATNPVGGVMFNNKYGSLAGASMAVTYTSFWQWLANVLTIYSLTDPATTYTNPGIAVGTRPYNIDGNFKNYVTYQDLTLAYAAANNLKWASVSGCILQRCVLFGSHGQGLNWYSSGTTRSDNNVVRYNKIYNSGNHSITYDVLETYGTGNYIDYNQVYQNNASGIKIGVTQTGQNNYIYNNDFIANRSWGIENTVAMTGWTIKNNLFHHNGVGDLTSPATSSLTFSNNLFYRDDAQTSVSYNGSNYTVSQIASFDATSIGSNAYQTTSSILSKNFSKAWFVDSNTIYAGDANARIWKSIDGGNNWTLLNTWATSTEFQCVWVAKNGYVYASTFGTLTAAEYGLWRSTDGGSTWARTLDLSAIPNCAVWGIDEDSAGNIYAGVYTSSLNAGNNAYIYKSSDHGGTFSQIYYDAPGKHIHQIKVDPKNDYIYATEGDGGTPWFTQKIIRSVDGGQNWTVLDNIVAGVGIVITPTARIFFTETAYILRTTDDVTFEAVYFDQLSASHAAFSVATYDSITKTIWGISTTSTLVSYGFPLIMSADDGMTWYPVRFQQSPTITYQGTTVLSNIVSNKLIYAIKINNVTLNSIMTNIAAVFYKQDFHIPSISPAINAGTSVGLTQDYEGNAVPYHTWGIVDIGAFEACSETLCPSFPLIPVIPMIGSR